MIISLSGPQSVGKTTLLTALRQTYKQWHFIDEITRKVKQSGLPINNAAENYNNTQINIIHGHTQNILAGLCYPTTCMDRCIIDGYVYTKYFFQKNKVNETVMYMAQRALDMFTSQYSHIFYIDPIGTSLVDDGVRSIDKDFQTDILSLFEETIPTIKNTQVTRISGPTKHRIKQIQNTLYGKLN